MFSASAALVVLGFGNKSPDLFATDNFMMMRQVKIEKRGRYGDDAVKEEMKQPAAYAVAVVFIVTVDLFRCDDCRGKFVGQLVVIIHGFYRRTLSFFAVRRAGTGSRNIRHSICFLPIIYY